MGRLTILAFLVLSLAVAGCARKKETTVTGKVTYANTPLPGGTISFYSETGTDKLPVYKTEINNDGTYLASGIPDTNLKVAIETESIRGSGPPRGVPAGVAAEYMAKTPGGKKYTPIPPKYRDPEASGLTLEAGTKTKDFNLTQ